MRMKQTRITVAFDQSTAELLERTSNDANLSQSEIMRRALRFYHENSALQDPSTRTKFHAFTELMTGGEHVILDVDHWLLFLKLVESSSNKEEFWKEHRKVARFHIEQLRRKVHTVEQLLERLESCNFFRVVRNSEVDFTLVLGSEIPKNFIKIFLEEYFLGMGAKVDIRENLAKLRVTIRQ